LLGNPYRFVPLKYGGMTAVDAVSAKIDSKGRILLPPALRSELDLEPGDTVSLKKTREGVVVTRGGKADYKSRLKQMLETPPPRLGKPLNPPPSKMKKIWKTA
jgi:AbrB family looped-hinge helix DNA binding protein